MCPAYDALILTVPPYRRICIVLLYSSGGSVEGCPALCSYISCSAGRASWRIAIWWNAP